MDGGSLWRSVLPLELTCSRVSLKNGIGEEPRAWAFVHENNGLVCWEMSLRFVSCLSFLCLIPFHPSSVSRLSRKRKKTLVIPLESRDWLKYYCGHGKERDML